MESTYLSGFDVDMNVVKQHYKDRKEVSKKLHSLLEAGSKEKYAELAVGASNSIANYSAHEHQLGSKILDRNSVSAIFQLAQKLSAKDLKVTHLPKTIYEANMPYIKISIGSEIACLLQPTRFWVGNVRTIWSHLLIKHKGDRKKANQELSLYKIDDASSEMHYQIWRDIYLSMETSLETINRIADVWSEEQGVKPGKLKYLWVDAICSALYDSK